MVAVHMMRGLFFKLFSFLGEALGLRFLLVHLALVLLCTGSSCLGRPFTLLDRNDIRRIRQGTIDDSVRLKRVEMRLLSSGLELVPLVGRLQLVDHGLIDQRTGPKRADGSEHGKERR